MIAGLVSNLRDLNIIYKQYLNSIAMFILTIELHTEIFLYLKDSYSALTCRRFEILPKELFTNKDHFPSLVVVEIRLFQCRCPR